MSSQIELISSDSTTLCRMANRIRDLREQRGMTVSAFARAVGVSERTVRHWEAGETDPTARNARQIARALGTSVDQVVTQEQAAAPRPLLVAAIIPHPDGRPEVLMTGRRYAQERVWSWPSGHVEPEETPEEAVIRELGEELVLQEPRIVRLLGVVDTHLDVSRWWGRQYRHGYVQHCFQVEIASPIVDVIDHEELVLVEWRSVEDLAAAFAHLPPEVSEPALGCAVEATQTRVPRMTNS